MPQLHSLRQDHSVQKQVEERLKQLASGDTTGTKIKSLRGGPVEVVVPNRVKWPHEFVLSGSNKERIQNDHLTTVQWVAGYCPILREERDKKIKDHMLDYQVISLMDDAHDFSWDAAMASHAVLLCRMEQGEVKSYSETDKLDRIRQANAQRHVTPPVDANNSQKRITSKVVNCTYFNRGTCMHIRSHETKGVTYRHVCSYCFQQNAKFFHMQSMTVETYFKKRVKRGGGTAASIQKFDTRYIYTSHVPFDKEELVVSKPVLTQCMKHANAVKKVTKNMSYAQALCTNSTVSASNLVQTVFGDIHKPHSATEAKTSPNMGIKTKLGILPGAPSLFVLPRISLKHDRIVKKVVRKVTHTCNTEVCGGSVTKPKNETYKALTVNALPLSNRFQPLQYSPDTEQIKATSKYEDNTQLSSAFPSSLTYLGFYVAFFSKFRW